MKKVIYCVFIILTVISVATPALAAYDPDNPDIFLKDAVTISRWEKLGSAWLAFDMASERIVNSFARWKGDYYVFNREGIMHTGWFNSGFIGSPRPGASPQLFLPSGKMATGWVREGTDWLYFEPDGQHLLYGWVKDKGKWYYIWSKKPWRGVMVTGWWTVDKKTYYFNPNGEMATGWIRRDGLWCYLKPDGSLAENEWVGYKNNWYYIRNGYMVESDWVLYKDNWYYLKVNGIMMHSGSMKVDGKTYKFDASGKWIR